MQAEIMKLTVQDIPISVVIPEHNRSAQLFKKNHQQRPGYEYEAVLSALLKKVLLNEKQPVYLDLGAFIGYFSFFPAKLLGDTNKVYAFESNPDYVAYLKQGAEINQLKNLEIIHAALSDQNEILYYEGNTVISQGPETQKIQAQTLDHICQQRGIQATVAKMDVHGFEGKMLGGMKALLHTSLKYLFLELHPNVYLEKFTPGITRMMILDQLEAAGFRNYYVAGHRYTWSDGMQRFFDTGKFAYQELTRETRGMLLFDRHNHVFILSSKTPLEDLIGPSIIDPSLE